MVLTEIFKKLLFPISSEFFQENVAKRIKKFVEIFGSDVYVVYIIEEKILKKMEDVAEPFLTEEQRKEIEENLIEKNREIADIVFNKLNNYIEQFERKVVVGEFSEEIIKSVREYNATCVVMGYEKDCFLKYRLFETLNIPIWVEIGKRSENVLGVCTNLAPNVRVPTLTLQIAEKFGYKPYLVYIIDAEEKVEVDEKGRKMERSIEELLEKAKEFAKKYENLVIDISVGALENEIVKYADRVNADLVIIGREAKKKRVFGGRILKEKGIKKELAEKIRHSVLFLN